MNLKDLKKKNPEELLKQAEKLGISERVVFLGFQRDVAACFASFDVSCTLLINGIRQANRKNPKGGKMRVNRV